ncbi:hypothetical protein P7B02_02255 [Caulobacter segnis]|uniref:hypothetical protein n=1 Tax=Caulobacter segnis TaxID=88688 RepID=UPI002410A229|nr:hypothetical protein [Caulobacter segnis]MDG2520349.1 hypothetical protein [Caulobacter segnis]
MFGQASAAPKGFTLEKLALSDTSGKISGNGKFAMTKTAQSALGKRRAKLARRGFVRLEVSVDKQDASLLRSVASALSDPVLQHETGRLLRDRFQRGAQTDLKALLASAPLDGIELDRDRDVGREVDL